MKSAEEWLIENNLLDTNISYDDLDKDFGYPLVSTIMERFANCRTKELQASIFSFRSKLKEELKEALNPGAYLTISRLFEEYDKHFEITEARNGQI